jgi:hypothetical protein
VRISRSPIVVSILATLGWFAFAACNSGSSASPACSELLACCGSMATSDLQASCMSKLPDTTDTSACSAQLSGYEAQGQCVDAGTDAAAPKCMTATFPCAPGMALEYCQILGSTGACSSSYYVVAGQTFVCTPCTDMSACGAAARNACAGDSGEE